MFGVIPYNIDVPVYRWPIANFVILGLQALIFVALLTGVLPIHVAEGMVLDGWGPLGLIGHVWLHAGLAHLGGNMIFLWTFGNAINSKLGNAAYVVVYLALALAAAVFHILFDGRAAVGASGAINGIVGMTLMLYPVSDLKMVWGVAWYWRTFRVRAFWMIGLWFFFDVWGALTLQGVVAYWAHIGGFVVGFAIAFVLVRFGYVKMVEYEISLLDMLGRSPEPDGLPKPKQTTAPRRANTAEPPAPREGDLGYPPAPTMEAPAALPEIPPAPSPPPPAPSLPQGPAPTLPASAPPAPPAPVSRKLKVTCDQCGRSMLAPRTFAGRQVRCPACKAVIGVPSS